MFRLKLSRVVVITAVWVGVGAVAAVYDHLSYLVFQEHADEYSFVSSLAGSTAGGFLGGLVGATTIVFYLKRTAAQHSFGGAIALHTFVSAGAIVLVVFIVSLLFQSVQEGQFPADPRVLRATSEVMRSPALLKLLLFWFVVGALTSLLLEVSDKYGPGVLGDFMRGRYHWPKVEERCFMFLDMRSSTAIAERLGHRAYFALLRSCFADMTAAIVEAGGQIYQYVGDEVVVSWPLAKGVADGCCIRCFHAIQAALERGRGSYQERFGLVPEFKAGLHAGQVTVGEVGTIRKDIVFSGDVLNTAARIQERCNILGHDLLVSDALLARLPDSFRRAAVALERIELRGRQEPITIHALPPRGNPSG